MEDACGDPINTEQKAPPVFDFICPPTSDSDFLERDEIFEKHMKTTNEKYGSWGPHPPLFPPVKVPEGVDPVEWQRARVLEVAKRYIGLPYKHHHVPLWAGSPEGQGVDCSNYTSWAYNYALGIKITSHCQKQAESEDAKGRKLGLDEKLEPADLLFIEKRDRSIISHVVLYLGDNKVLDSRGKGGVQIRDYDGWYKTHHIFTRRMIE